MGVTADGKHEVCDSPGCGAKIKAENWFFEKSGSAWCPLHHPEWVAEWRARIAAREKKDGHG